MKKIIFLYCKALQFAYKHLFSGPCRNIAIKGLIDINNPKSVWIGNNVLIKKRSALLASPNPQSIIISNNSEIHENCVLRSSTGYIHIGKYVSLNRSGIILGAGGVVIGNYVRIGPRVNILSNNHVFTSRSIPIMKQGKSLKKIVIEDDVWIGANVTIVPGVTIKKGAVVGAGTVVTQNIDKYHIMAGVPARVIGTR